MRGSIARIAVLALIVAPLAALAPVAPAAAATTVTDWDALRSAIDEGGTQQIALGADITAPAGERLALAPGDDVTLDLAGRTLSIGVVTAPADGAAIRVPSGASLTIADALGGGRLTVRGGEMGAGIGGDSGEGVGAITIAGGAIEVEGGRLGAGIGGGSASYGAGTITITGGDLTVVGGQGGAGIGVGQTGGPGGTIAIAGGRVSVDGGFAAAGIGGGSNATGAAPSVTITGGVVTATGWTYAAGIGGGYRGHGGPVTISGGSVTARGGGYAPGIGGGARTSEQTASDPGPLTLIGRAQPGSVTTGVVGSNPGGSLKRGTAATATILDGPKAYLSSGSVELNGGRFVIDFGWLVSFDADGGEPAPAAGPVLLHEGALVPEPATPAKAGHLFAGWRADGPDGPRWDFASDRPSADVLLVARWAEIFDIDYDLAGGDPVPDNPVAYTEFDEVTLAAPTRDGYVFIGWTGTGLTEPTPEVVIALGSTGDRSYTANWEPDTPTNIALPSISGTTGWGDTLTADPGSWDLDGLAYDYRWLRNGVPIEGATSASYTIGIDDLTEQLSVEVTAYRAGDDRYHPASATSTPVAIPVGALQAGTPTLDGLQGGEAPVGTTLTVSPGNWGPEDVVLGYRWFVGDDPDPAATGTSFTPTAADLGKQIRVEVTGSRDRFAPATRTSAAAPVVPGTIAVAGTLGIAGIPGVGHELAATGITWEPASAAPAYRWDRDGEPIAGATGAAYLLTPEDEGARISLTVTLTIDGYHDRELTTGELVVDARPGYTPDPVDEGGFTDENALGDADRQRTTATVGGLEDVEGRWVYVYGHSVPVGLGWYRVTGGRIVVETGALDAEAHRLAVLDVRGDLVGWAALPVLPQLAGTGSDAPLPLLGGALALVLAGAALTVLPRWRRVD